MFSKPEANIGPRHAKWAEEHDWYRSRHQIKNWPEPLYKIVARDETTTMGIRYFENFEEMSAWAGY